MIKFFRRIRQRLLSDPPERNGSVRAGNRFSKYLIYAIGEIALVIIGILIALNINSRAELKKTEAKIDKLFENVLEEIDTGIEATTKLAKDYSYFDSIFYKVQKNKLTIDDYKNRSNFRLFSLIGRVYECRLNQDAFDNLMLNRDDIPVKYEQITKDLIRLYKTKSLVDKYDEKTSENAYRHGAEKAKNHEWFSQIFDQDNQERIDYLLNDFTYKNEVLLYYNYAINSHLSFALSYREYAFSLYQKISDLLENPKQPQSYKIEKDIAEKFIGKWIYTKDTKNAPEFIEYEVKDNCLFQTDNLNNGNVDKRELIIIDINNDYVRSVAFSDSEGLRYQSMTFKNDSLKIQLDTNEGEYIFTKSKE